MKQLEEITEDLLEYFEEHYKPFIDDKMEILEMEKDLLSMMMMLGHRVEQAIFDKIDKGYQGSIIEKDKMKYKFVDNIERTVHALFGQIIFKRAYYFNLEKEGQNYTPMDKKLGIEKGYTNGCQFFLSKFTAKQPFQDALNDFHDFFRRTGIGRISLKKAEEITYDIGNTLELLRQYEMYKVKTDSHYEVKQESAVKGVMAVSIDATGVRHKIEEKIDKNGKKTYKTQCKEAKIACISEVKWNEDRQEAHCVNSSYVSSYEEPDIFFERVYVEMLKRSKDLTNQKLVFLGDGAPWILDRAYNIADANNVILILDFYHASEYLHAVAKACYGEETDECKDQHELWCQQTKQGKIKDVIDEMKELILKNKNVEKIIQKSINYLTDRIDKMKYDEYIKMGLPIGSGSVESACKNVIGSRLKQSGMIWTEDSSLAMLQLRCSLKSQRLYREYYGSLYNFDSMKKELAKAA